MNMFHKSCSNKLCSLQAVCKRTYRRRAPLQKHSILNELLSKEGFFDKYDFIAYRTLNSSIKTMEKSKNEKNDFIPVFMAPEHRQNQEF